MLATEINGQSCNDLSRTLIRRAQESLYRKQATMWIYFEAPGCYRDCSRAQKGSNSLSRTCRWIFRYAASKSQRQVKPPSFLPSVVSLLMTGNLSTHLFSPLLYKVCASRIHPTTWILKISGPSIFDASGETFLGFSVGDTHSLSFIQRVCGLPLKTHIWIWANTCIIPTNLLWSAQKINLF